MEMKIEDLLTIVIPTKNEEGYIGRTLQCLYDQHIGNTQVIIADAGSTDSTESIVLKFFDRLNIRIIQGGLPSVGRNAGARAATTKYVLFMDADCEVRERGVIYSCLSHMERKWTDLLSVHITCDDFGGKLLYWMNDIVVRLSTYDRPFAVGTYMMVRRDMFHFVGGFDENALHCEDYVFSRKFDTCQFDILNKKVYADSRRFKKMGHLNYVRYVLRNVWNRNDPDYFKKDVGYWSV